MADELGSNGAPRAREDGLVVERVGEELLVYDLDRDRVHCLNETAGFVFERCDGEHSVAQLGELLSETYGHQVGGDVVRLTLTRLSDAHLLERPPSQARSA